MKRSDIDTARIAQYRAEVCKAIDSVGEDRKGFSFGFVWGTVSMTHTYKNGKVKNYAVKVCFGSHNPASWDKALAAAARVPGVSSLYVNMD